MPKIAANGTQTAFSQTGDGPPLVLIHGAEADHTMFGKLVPLLAAKFTVIAYDQRDSGETTNPSLPYSLRDLGRDAAALIEALGFDKAHVFGSSLGGFIGQHLASEYPARVDRLVLGSTFRADKHLGQVNPDVAHKIIGLRAELPESAPKIAEFFFPPPFLAAHPELAEIFSGNRRDEGQRARRAAMMHAPVPVDLRAIEAPTLLLAGGQDRLIPFENTMALKKEIPHAETVVLDGVGHVTAIQAPDALAREIIAFLAR